MAEQQRTPDEERAESRGPARSAPRPSRRERVRVVITGVGALTPVGLDAQSTFDALLKGESGVAIWSGATEALDVRIAGQVKGFDPRAVLGEKQSRRHARFTHLACAAALEAARDAGLAQAGYPGTRIATLFGVGMGGIEHFSQATEAMLTEGPRRISPFGLTALVPNMAPALVARLLGAHGPSFSVSSACASSSNALGIALDLLRSGRADVAVAGGAEGCVFPIGIAAFARMGALSRRNHDPRGASRPFDRDRDGFVMAEGAGALVLETLEAARARGARIYAELAGAGASADAFHDTQPDPEGRGAEQAIRNALEDAELAPEQVSYINAHATSTQLGDRSETYAIKRAFGKHATKLCVGSTKSMTGHMLGAAGAVECIITALAIARGEVPPTINVDAPDPECDLDYISEGPRKLLIEAALSNNFGFGGQNAAVVLKRVSL